MRSVVARMSQRVRPSAGPMINSAICGSTGDETPDVVSSSGLRLLLGVALTGFRFAIGGRAQRLGPSSSTVDDRFRQRPASLPAFLFKGGGVALLHWIADAEIPDERPVRRYIEDLGNAGRLQDRKPADADSLGAGGKPKRMNSEHGGILDHFRHRQPSEAVALGCRTICKDCNLARRVVQSFKLQPGIERHSLCCLIRQRVSVACPEAFLDGIAPGRAVDDDETPWLAEAYRRSEASKLQQAIERPIRKRLALEAPDVTAPDHQVPQPGAKIGVKIRWSAHARQSSSFNPQLA